MWNRCGAAISADNNLTGRHLAVKRAGRRSMQASAVRLQVLFLGESSHQASRQEDVPVGMMAPAGLVWTAG